MKREPTPFEKSVYALLGQIPRGKVVTYAEIARALGCGSAQAIGQALKRNPYAPEVPCHRVIKTSLTVGGYEGALSGVTWQKKICLLKEEGIEFGDDGKLLKQQAVYQFP